MALIGYIPRNWKKKRITPNLIQINHNSGSVCEIPHPHDDDRAEIHADLIVAIPDMLRALCSIESYAQIATPSPEALRQIEKWATAALAAANWKE